jgi:hypothetical protein
MAALFSAVHGGQIADHGRQLTGWLADFTTAPLI